MPQVYKDRVKQVCAAPTTTNPFDFTGSATALGYQTFVAALADGDTVVYAAEDASGNWEIGIGTWTTASDQLARTTILSSSNGGSAETFSGDTTVYVTADATTLRKLHSKADSIDGLICGYSATTTASISTGYVWIEGVRYAQGSATTLALTAGNEIGGSALAANSLLFIYAYNNAGTLTYKWDLRASTSDDPVYSEDLQYWYHSSQGTGYRLIGVLRTEGTGILDNPTVVACGRRSRQMSNASYPQILSVTGQTQGSVAMASYVPKNGTAFVSILGAGLTSGTPPVTVQAMFSLRTGVGSTAAQVIAKGVVQATLNTNLFGQNTLWCNSQDSIYAACSGTNDYARVFFIGFIYEV